MEKYVINLKFMREHPREEGYTILNEEGVVGIVNLVEDKLILNLNR
jgi:hypothetical protein